MERPSYDTVILSDLHLGSETSKAREARTALQRIDFRRLILLGDIFCDLNFRRLTKEHWKFLSFIRKLSNPKRRVEVVWVEGNHDYGLASLMSHLVGVPVYREYLWEIGGEKYLAVHGHQFDTFVLKDRLFLSSVGAYLFLLLQKLDSKGNPMTRFLDRLNTRWLRLSDKVQAGALVRARIRGASHVFCGHTHQAAMSKSDGICYYNAGAWTTQYPTYITICEQEITIHEFIDGIDYCRSSQKRGKTLTPIAGLSREPGLSPDSDYQGAYC